MLPIQQASSRQAETLTFVDSLVTIQVAQQDNADGISVLEHRLCYGSAPPVHVHHEEDEIFHIIEGEIRFQVGGQSLIGRAGDTLLAPRGTPHGFRVLSPDGARALSITRGGFERMVRTVSQPAQGDRLPAPAAPTPAMQAALASACLAEQIELLGPPID